MPRIVTYRRTPPSPADDPHQVSPTALALLRPVTSPGHYAIDIGCGSGRFTFEVAPRVAHAVGIDLDMEAIDNAQSAATGNGIDNVTFFVADAEDTDYSEFLMYEPYDLVTASLCLSDEIVRRVHTSLRRGGRFLFVALEADQWTETGRPSQFAYEERPLRSLLRDTGFEIEHLSVETAVLDFGEPERLASWLDREDLPDWLDPARAEGLRSHAGTGGTTLTNRSHLIGRAVKN